MEQIRSVTLAGYGMRSRVSAALAPVQDEMIAELAKQAEEDTPKRFLVIRGNESFVGGERKIDPKAPALTGALLIGKRPRGPLATVFLRKSAVPYGKALGLAWFPNELPDRVAAVRAVLLEWAPHDPDAFPGVADWESSSEWATGPEIVALDQFQKVQEEKQRTVDAFDTELRSRLDALNLARDKARATVRRLLTTQGAPLVEAVRQAFADFGFEVRDMDEGRASNAPKVEDLRIAVPPHWEALVEVRGYDQSGGKTHDLQRLQRFARFYMMERKCEPSKLLYVVNGSFGLPPNLRRQPLAGAEEDVAQFASGGGLVIGTIDFFRLHRDLGVKVTKEQACEFIMSTTGVLRYP